MTAAELFTVATVKETTTISDVHHGRAIQQEARPDASSSETALIASQVFQSKSFNKLQHTHTTKCHPAQLACALSSNWQSIF